ncbi:MAG: hypothetical protein HKN25_17900 [Pyrinomonadaceae bacterium]|nr:hypothetical protein [Pyrinomonadaceae bacterium]
MKYKSFYLLSLFIGLFLFSTGTTKAQLVPWVVKVSKATASTAKKGAKGSASLVKKGSKGSASGIKKGSKGSASGVKKGSVASYNGGKWVVIKSWDGTKWVSKKVWYVVRKTGTVTKRIIVGEEKTKKY